MIKPRLPVLLLPQRAAGPHKTATTVHRQSSSLIQYVSKGFDENQKDRNVGSSGDAAFSSRERCARSEQHDAVWPHR
ncbi:hypothetical protein PSP6_210153 [Paraburkholderia tropica]|nr:hypothetical protein PSP6_210153 [Paraburkholderia tropica]